jgi:sugar phosphate isomerase/epimerase
MPDVSPQETVKAAAAAGWPAVGVWIDMTTWTATTTREIKALLSDNGLSALDAEVVWLRPGEDDSTHFRALDIAAELGAPNVLVVSSAPEASDTATRLARLADHGRPAGVRVSLEFGAFTSVRSLPDALRALELTQRPDVGLLVDPLHFARTGGAPADLAAVDPGRFAYAQFCDARASGPSPDDVAAIIEEALDLRLMPGEGELPLAGLVGDLPPGTPLSVELRSKVLREGWPVPADRARVLLESTRAWLAGAGEAG